MVGEPYHNRPPCVHSLVRWRWPLSGPTRVVVACRRPVPARRPPRRVFGAVAVPFSSAILWFSVIVSRRVVSKDRCSNAGGALLTLREMKYTVS